MTRTRLRPPLRADYATRRSAPRRSGRRSRLSVPSLPLYLLVRPLAWLLWGGLAIALAAAMVFLLVPFLARSILSLLGLGGVVLVPGLGAAFWQWRRLGTPEFARVHGRHLLGGVLLFCGALAVVSLVRPAGAAYWGVNWAEVSLGGLLGQLLLGDTDVERVLRSLVPFAAGLALVFPRAYSVAGKWLARGMIFLGSLRLPQRFFVLLRRALARAGAVVRRSSSLTPDASAPALEIAAGGTWIAGDQDHRTPEDLAPMEEAEEAYPPIQSALLPIVERPGGAAVSEEDEATALDAPVWNRWELPTLGLMEQGLEAEPVDQTQRARQIEEALSSYGVDAKVVQIHVGPAVTQFGVEPGWDRKLREVKEREPGGRVKLDKEGVPKVKLEEVSRTRVKVERISGLANNLAMALAAPSVRIEAPVPGKQMVGIEVPNHTPSLVALRSVVESAAFQRLKARSKLALALGKGVSGDAIVADLAKMPHLLIAGATGSGKSVCINSIVCCLLMHCSPDDVRFLMVDPKRVELVPYNPIPHLLGPVIVDAEKVVGTLHWVLKEMEERYRKFAAAGVRNIEGYNRSPKARERMPFWVLIIDELADLMMVAPYEVERGLCRLAQLARATGIHLVVATQRPSVDVVTGLIKANFPTRISFAVTSHIDSRTILDSSGAEKLLGRGDMLYMPTDAAKPKRVQGTFVSDGDIERIVGYWGSDAFRLLRPSQYAEEMELAAVAATNPQDEGPDALLERARELAEGSERVSTSFLQRRLRIGYPRAARLMEALRDEGYGEGGGAEDGY